MLRYKTTDEGDCRGVFENNDGSTAMCIKVGDHWIPIGSTDHVLANSKATAQISSYGSSAIISSNHRLVSPIEELSHPLPENSSIQSSSWPALLAMSRPSNIPGVVLLHMLGIFLVTRNTNTLFWPLFIKPRLMVTLLVLVLTSSTSMLVNDYYDFKLGHDAFKTNKPLPSRKIALSTVRKALTFLYAMSLLCVAIVPGAPARCTVTLGLILTFGYTQHLKPKTWVKNMVCAALIALSPLTSGVATMGLLQKYSWSDGILPLSSVVSTLFVGILGREMTMDLNDVIDDSKHGIHTVPAVYGPKFASAVGLVCSLGVLALSTSGPLWELCVGRRTTTPFTILLRRLFFASLGSLAQLRRSWQVVRTKGQDPNVVETSVNEGLLSVVLILIGFV